MNTKSLLTRIGVPVLSLGLLGGLGATLATSASAATTATTLSAVSSSATVTASTHLNNHPDTTSVPTGVTSDNGPVWAYDNITEKYTAVQQDNGSWLVTIGFVGSFHGFANPRTADEMNLATPVLTSPAPGAALDSAGSVKGTIQYIVTSGGSPDASNLPGQSPSDATLHQLITKLFGGSATITDVPGSYSFTYHQVEGQDYTQVG